MLGTIKCNTRTPLRLLPNASLRQRPATSPAALTIRFTIRRGAANDYARAHAARNKKQEKQKRETASHAGASHTQSLRTRREKTRTGRNDNTHHSPLESQLPPAAALRLSSLASPPTPTDASLPRRRRRQRYARATARSHGRMYSFLSSSLPSFSAAARHAPPLRSDRSDHGRSYNFFQGGQSVNINSTK